VLQQGVLHPSPSLHGRLPSHRQDPPAPTGQLRARRPAALLARLGAVCALACTAVALPTASADAAPALSWSAPAQIGGGQTLSGVSCASRALCVAVSKSGNAFVSTDPAAGAGATWREVDVAKGAALSAISCPTDGLCVAVDEVGSAFVSTSPATISAGAWAQVPIDGSTPLTSISCASSSLCVAVDGKGQALVSGRPTSATPSAWTSFPIDGATALSGVSCASSSLCVAVAGDGNAIVSTEPTAGASAWHRRAIDTSLGLTAVSCYAPGWCVAVDESGDALASANPAAGGGTAATWSSTAFDALGSSAVACAASGLCVTVDGAGDAFASDDPTVAPPSWTLTAQIASGLTGAACVAEGLCAAVGSGGHVSIALVPGPSATTKPASEVAHTTALLTGTVDPRDAVLGECRFEYGTTTAYGASVPCASLPTGSSELPVSAAVAGLAPSTTYYYRLVASTAVGTSEGTAESFKTLAPALVEPHPSISGIPAQGQRLTCKSGVTATSGVTLAYAWLRNTATIAGAAESTYVVSAADVSHQLQCRVTATTAEGSKSVTSGFVTVPAGGLGTIAETVVGTPRVGRGTVSVPLKCSPAANGSCKLQLSLTVQETLSGSRVVAVAARTRRTTVTIGSKTVRLKPGQQATATVSLNAAGRRLLARMHKLAVRLSVSGTVVGAISASLKSATLTLTASGKAASHKASRGGVASPRDSRKRAAAARHGTARSGRR
jgi:hypothetical protein